MNILILKNNQKLTFNLKLQKNYKNDYKEKQLWQKKLL